MDGLTQRGAELMNALAKARDAGASALQPILIAVDERRTAASLTARAELKILLSGAPLDAAVNTIDPTVSGPPTELLPAANATPDVSGFLRERLPPDAPFWRLRDDTAWVDGSGAVEFRKDIYGRDGECRWHRRVGRRSQNRERILRADPGLGGEFQVFFGRFEVMWGGFIMSELGSVMRLARLAVVDRTLGFLPCLALAGTLLFHPFAPSWAAPDDHNGKTTVAAPAAEPTSDPALIGAIRDLANNGPVLDQLIDFDATALQQLYADRDYQPIWVTNAGLQPAAEALLSTLERLERSGALPHSADVAAASARRSGGAAAGLAETELLLSSALIRTAVDPEDLLAPGPRPQVLEAAGNSDDNEQFLHQWLPPDPAFWRLRAAIDGYRVLADHGGWPSVSAGPKLEPGARDGRIVQIRQRLLATGDLVGDSAEPDIYDNALLEAVKRFQARHGLAPDGIIGFGTIDAFNVPAEARLASMIFNLRRLYTQARDWGDNYVMVNLAAAQLKLVQGGTITASYNVIVGRRDRPSPEVHSAINRLEFNPYWNVPAGIYAKDFLPKLRKDPDFINHYRNIRVYRASEPANEVDPSTIDWFSPEARQMRLRLRQDPGPENALGPAKFLFPNSYDVYLHGTNKQSLFAKADRFLSSGCIRLPDPLGFAQLLLKNDPNWPRSNIDAAVAAKTNRGVALATPLPVHLVYDTAWVDEIGTVQFRQDVYGRDQRETAVAERGGKG